MKTLKDLLTTMKEHQVLDNLVQGVWWENGKGCFYGCPMQTDERAIESACETYGIPLWIGYWSEGVFEGLTKEQAKLWPVELLEAMIEFKGDYEDVRHKLAVKRLTYLSEKTTGEVKSAIDGVINYHITRDESLREEAASATRSAARSAYAEAGSATRSVTRSAARSAARSASSWLESAAESALWSVEAAASSAESASESWVAAAAAEWSAVVEAWERERDWMLEILEQGE